MYDEAVERAEVVAGEYRTALHSEIFSSDYVLDQKSVLAPFSAGEAVGEEEGKPRLDSLPQALVDIFYLVGLKLSARRIGLYILIESPCPFELAYPFFS